MGNDGITIGVVVAHPDDETLWAGGTLLLHPEWQCRIVTLCRASDADRASRFQHALARLGAAGAMGDLDDGPEQRPLESASVEQEVLELLGDTAFDLLLTHGQYGEYTWHARHVETSRAVCALWRAGRLRARQLWLFAYEDGLRAYLPRAAADAAHREILPAEILAEKYRIIREVYGFSLESWEARTTPVVEAFYCLSSPAELVLRAQQKG